MRNKGFSLIELIVVILIMAILAVALVPNVIRFVDKARKNKDIETANAIARAIDIAFICNPEAYETYQNWNKVAVNVSATTGGVTENYKVYLVAASEGPIYCFKGGERTFGDKNGKTGFYGVLNEELGLSTEKPNTFFLPTFHEKREGTGPKSGYSWEEIDRWRIVKRADNGQLEIWSAQPNPYGGYPVYRVYPRADDVYK